MCSKRSSSFGVSVGHASCTWSKRPMVDTDQSHPHLVMMVVGGTPGSTPRRWKKAAVEVAMSRERRQDEGTTVAREGNVDVAPHEKTPHIK